jgi:hypothetical protein
MDRFAEHTVFMHIKCTDCEDTRATIDWKVYLMERLSAGCFSNKVNAIHVSAPTVCYHRFELCHCTLALISQVVFSSGFMRHRYSPARLHDVKLNKRIAVF